MRYALTLTSNLMFRSKLDAMLAANQLVSKRIKAVEDISRLIADSAPSIAVIDLATSTTDPVKVVRALRDDHHLDIPILCFGSHMKTELMEQAREAGANKVVANSAMSGRGAELIRSLLSSG